MEKLIETVMKLDVKNGDVIVLKSDDIRSDRVYKIFNVLDKAGLKNITIIGLRNNESIETINEEYMNKLGWHRK